MNLFDFTSGGVESTVEKIGKQNKLKDKRIKNKSYETRGYDYYDKKESLNIICQVLAYNGWVIYGYKEDRSDYMTDYYDPARWDGIAVKNGYILVMNKSHSGAIAGNYVLRSYSKDANEIIKKLIDKNQKLSTLANNEAASEGEKTNDLAMIEKNNKKIQSCRNEYYIEEDNNNPYPANLPEVNYQKNPGRATWHIEKDGKIIDKGTGYFKFCDIDGMKYFVRPSTIYFEDLKDNHYAETRDRYTEESWKIEYEHILKRQDKNEGILDAFMNFIQLLESKVKLVIGEGENEQLVKVVKEVKEIYYTAEATTEKTDYIQVGNGWSKVSGLSSGNIYKLEDNKVFKLTRKSYSNNGQYISSYKPNPNKSTNPIFVSSVEEKIDEKKLTYVKLVENYITYEKEEWVKPAIKTKKSKSPANKKTEDENDSKSEIDYEEFLNRGVIKTDTNKKSISYKYVSTEILDLDVFKGLCSYLKSNKLGFYIKGKGFYLNSLNEVAA